MIQIDLHLLGGFWFAEFAVFVKAESASFPPGLSVVVSFHQLRRLRVTKRNFQFLLILAVPLDKRGW